MTQYFNELAKRFNWESNYQIWIASMEHPVFELIEGTIEPTTLPFQNLTSHNDHIFQIILNDNMFIVFTYPGNYQIMLNLYEYKTLTEGELVVLFHYLYPYYTNAAIKRERYKLGKVIESTRRASATLSTEEIYSNILSYAMDVIPNCDIGTLWWFDEEKHKLTCKASAGNILKGINQMEFDVDEGPVGYTFRKEVPLLSDQKNHSMWETIGNISTANSKYWDPSYEFTKQVKSFLTYPIRVDDKVEGVIFLCQIVKPYPLSDEDLHLLQGFSSQVGISIRNARQYSHIKNLNDVLMRRDDIHATLTKLSIQNKGVVKIVEEMSRMMGKNVLFVDLLENEVTPITEKLPVQLTYKDLNGILQNVIEQPFYELRRSGYVTHIIYPIRSMQITLGCIIVETATQIEQLDTLVMEQGHSVLALELVRKQNDTAFYYKKRRELFSELVNSKDQSIVLQKAQELNISLHEPCNVTVFKLSQYKSPHHLEAFIHRLTAQLKRDLFSYIQLLYAYHDEVTVVISVNNTTDKPFRKKLQSICNEWGKEKSVTLSCGLGTTYQDVYFLPKTFDEAKTALAYLTSRGQHGLIDYSQIGVNRLFIKQDQQEIKHFLAEVFEPLRTKQSKNNSLEETLIIYIDTNRSAVKAAELLHVHINTLYQRLKKIEEVLAVSFQQPGDLLKLQLACYLKQSYSHL
ncbi:helix-turn-helix domain-containing protein [Lysinibacillus sp. NPDC097195]|uniref:helix-turn-helix domain-containing protein n=1 Tax=Lysinibacillus sp. NPDC097195 TaxID=3364141 RepID=UPI0038108E1E